MLRLMEVCDDCRSDEVMYVDMDDLEHYCDECYEMLNKEYIKDKSRSLPPVRDDILEIRDYHNSHFDYAQCVMYGKVCTS